MYCDDISAGKYKVNRPLTADERANHLNPREVSTPYISTGNSVIRMNSTYLELVDKFFRTKGRPTTCGILSAVIGLAFLLFVLSFVPEIWSDFPKRRDYLLQIFLPGLSLIFSIIMIVIAWWMLKQETVNNYTHCPIRFNRINRKVYIFRPDGTVMVEDWDRLYFHLSRGFHLGKQGYFRECEVQGHRLGPDGETVLETFSLPSVGIRKGYSGFVRSVDLSTKAPDPNALRQWEFVRRYMENGPQDVYNLVDLVQNVNGRRQTWAEGLHTLFDNYSPRNTSWVQKLLTAALCVLFFLYVLIIPCLIFDVLTSFVRVVVMRLNKLPEWGCEIERECAVEPGDPYIRDAEHLATHDEAFSRAERIKWECEQRR